MRTFDFILIILTVCFNSCTEKIDINDGNDDNTIYGTGALTSHNLSLNSFSKINLTGYAKISVVKGDVQSVVVRAQQNIFDVLDIHTSGSNLYLGVKKNYSISTQEGIFVDIVSPEITDVSIVGSGDLTISGGTQESFNISVTGAGNVNAYGLDVNHTRVTISGSALCLVKAISTLDIIISGAGTVRYKGNPTISQVISGVGSVINDN